MSAATLPRLLADVRPGAPPRFAEHLERHGALTDAAHHGDALIAAVASAGLRGRGGAGFPTGTKLRAVADGRGRHALVVNGAEGEPMSAKDRVLLEAAPHLVIDGTLLAADAIGARTVVIAVKRSAATAHDRLERALAERRDTRRVQLRAVPDAYLAGEESALIHHLNGGPAIPTLSPPLPFERGLGRRPTLVANVETLAHVGLIARHGPEWFRAVGTPSQPGSLLVTVDGAVDRPGVYEIPAGAPMRAVLTDAGGAPDQLRAVLVGGYYGSWLTREAAVSSRLEDASLRKRHAALGAGVLVALPADACPAAEVARVVRWMATESAGQCGPCVHGLDAIAAAVDALVTGTARRDVLDRLRRWSDQVEGRGACHHPNGVVRFLRSSLTVFAAELDDHRRHGACDACGSAPVLVTAGRRERAA